MSSRALILGAAALAVLAALGGLGAFQWHQGWADGHKAASAACEATRRATEAANADAITTAERDLIRAADALSLKTMEIGDALGTIDTATAADPDGGLVCLPPGSVQRLNAIR